MRKSGQPVKVVHEHYQVNGERRFVEVVASPLWGTGGSFQGIIESVRDIKRTQIERFFSGQTREVEILAAIGRNEALRRIKVRA